MRTTHNDSHKGKKGNTMEKMNATALANAIRSQYSDMVTHFLEEKGETILPVGAGKYALPCTDADGNDAWVTISISVPKGTRDGDPYDGYDESAFYTKHLEEQAEKKRKAEELRAQKEAEKARKKAEREAKKAAETEEE